jgi:hypothetical protein
VTRPRALFSIRRSLIGKARLRTSSAARWTHPSSRNTCSAFSFSSGLPRLKLPSGRDRPQWRA